MPSGHQKFSTIFDLENAWLLPDILIDSGTKEPLMAARLFIWFPSINY